MSLRGRVPFYESVTPEQLTSATRRVRGGAPLDAVLAAEFGCSDRAVRRFRAEGERVADAAEDGAELTPRETKALELWQAVNKAWHEAELLMLHEIRTAERVTVEERDGKTYRRQSIWQTRAWILERTRRERYALSHTPPVGLTPPPSGPAPNTPEWEAALIDMLAAKPDLLEKAAAKAKERR